MLAAHSIDQRIADACKGADLSAAELAVLLEQAIIADEEAVSEFAAAKTKALDPATGPAEVEAARKAMEDAQFRRDRLAIGAKRVDQMHVAAMRRERDQAAKDAVSAALVERDALAVELAEAYPRLAGELAELLGRVQANRQRLGTIHPDAEVIARKLPQNYRARPSDANPTILDARLPDWRGRDGSSYGLLYPNIDQWGHRVA